MPNRFLKSIVFGTTVLLIGSASAQAPAPAPAPVPEAAPFDIPYGMPITLEQARKVADAAMAEARKHNWKEAIAIVDPAGELVYFVKMDGTQNAGPNVAISKARSSALFRRPTKVFFDAMESGHPYVVTLPGMSGADSGLPIVENGKIIGAIGTSGATGAQDAVVSKAGVDVIK